MSDAVNQLALDGGDTEATTKAANAARIAALDAMNVADAALRTAQIAAERAHYTAAIAAEEACNSSANALVYVDPNAEEE